MSTPVNTCLYIERLLYRNHRGVQDKSNKYNKNCHSPAMPLNAELQGTAIARRKVPALLALQTTPPETYGSARHKQSSSCHC